MTTLDYTNFNLTRNDSFTVKLEKTSAQPISVGGSTSKDAITSVNNFSASLESLADVSAGNGNTSVNMTNSTWVDPCLQDYFIYEDFTQIDWVRIVFIVLYSMIITLSVLGNIMVIWTVWRNKHMQTVTNYYIVNLAVSDLLVSAFVMPLKLVEYVAPCKLHVFSEDAMCSVVSFVLPVFVFASVLTLVAISIERYYSIIYPLNAYTIHTKSKTRKILAATWIVPLIVAVPYVFNASQTFAMEGSHGRITLKICQDRFDDIDRWMYGQNITELETGTFRKGYFYFLFAVIYLIPLIVITATCIRIAVCLLEPIYGSNNMKLCRRGSSVVKKEESKRKVAKMIIVVAATFCLSWSPFYLVTFISQVQHPNTFMRESNFIFTMLAIHFSGFLNSCVNPVIYATMSHRFRRSFVEIIGIIFCCLCFFKLDEKRFGPKVNRVLNAFSAASDEDISKSYRTEIKRLSNAGSSIRYNSHSLHIQARNGAKLNNHRPKYVSQSPDSQASPEMSRLSSSGGNGQIVKDLTSDGHAEKIRMEHEPLLSNGKVNGNYLVAYFDKPNNKVNVATERERPCGNIDSTEAISCNDRETNNGALLVANEVMNDPNYISVQDTPKDNSGPNDNASPKGGDSSEYDTPKALRKTVTPILNDIASLLHKLPSEVKSPKGLETEQEVERFLQSNPDDLLVN
ncbi:unnamed protein product [Owenia fusiformis]|uniref:G-protein coupled receptors family 1 profile domain-containing protein n=1 Tax=Owenia fusiformis TaxID=6347 RepID=A0A8S4PE45_OWEFU|nr:unnamed protein product [Owenia fusiformis]